MSRRAATITTPRRGAQGWDHGGCSVPATHRNRSRRVAAAYSEGMSEHRSPFLFLASILLVLAACGGDDDSAGSTSTAAPVATRSTTTAPSAADEPTAPPDEPDEGEDRADELLGRWEITNYVLPGGGGLTNVVGSEPVFIEFDADGSVSYHTGCNAGSTTFTTSGTYAVPKSALDDTLEGQPITIGPDFAQTEIGCEGFLGDQDRDLPIDLGAATRFTFNGDVLRLLDEFLLVEATRST